MQTVLSALDIPSGSAGLSGQERFGRSEHFWNGPGGLHAPFFGCIAAASARTGYVGFRVDWLGLVQDLCTQPSRVLIPACEVPR